MRFFSACLRFAVLVDDGRPRRRNTWCDSIVTFRARDWEHARDRALELGRKQETTYENRLGETVRWALVGVETVDMVGRRLDGVEVWSRMYTRVAREPVSPRKRFRPEASEPASSGCAGELAGRPQQPTHSKRPPAAERQGLPTNRA